MPSYGWYRAKWGFAQHVFLLFSEGVRPLKIVIRAAQAEVRKVPYRLLKGNPTTFFKGYQTRDILSPTTENKINVAWLYFNSIVFN